MRVCYGGQLQPDVSAAVPEVPEPLPPRRPHTRRMALGPGNGIRTNLIQFLVIWMGVDALRMRMGALRIRFFFARPSYTCLIRIR